MEAMEKERGATRIKMEEDIKILEEMKNNCLTKRDYIDEKAEIKAQAIENLINKYKEQEKVIDFMIEWIRERSIYGVDSHEKLKDYFKKKVRDENENPR